jgi:spore maturation protein CgeB
MGHSVATFDWREAAQKGQANENKVFLEAHKELKPDFTLIIKGLGLTGQTMRELRTFHKGKVVGWIFDVTLGGTLVKDVPPYVEFIKELDKFYTMDVDAVDELKKLGVNAEWLTEGCYIEDHSEQVFNSFQQKKYGADVVFIGSLGGIHPNRDKLLKRIADEGFDFKLYGDVFYSDSTEPKWVIDHHTGYGVINNYHSLVCNTSKIVIGIDGWPERDKSMSARIYRTLCCGGFLLTTHTKNIEELFTPGVHLDVFDNEDDMVEKILYYLQNDDKRQKIAKAGQELVQKEHTFGHRLKKILDENI